MIKNKDLVVGTNYVVYYDFKTLDFLDKNPTVMANNLERSARGTEMCAGDYDYAWDIQQEFLRKGAPSVIAEVFADQIGAIRWVAFDICLFTIKGR